MRRIDGKRRQHRKDVLQEILLRARSNSVLPRSCGSTRTIFSAFNSLAQFPPAALLLGGEQDRRARGF